MKKKIAVFDFDNTLTTKDSFVDLIIYTFGKKVYFRLLKLTPIFICFKLGILSRQISKEKMFSMFFKGKTNSEFNNICNEYVNKRIQKIINYKTLNKLKMHQQNGDIVIILSASLENWLKIWADKNKIDNVISTKCEIVNEVVTGKFATGNCYGQEKVNRFRAFYGDENQYYIYMYGDSRGDKEMLEIANEKFYRKV